MGLLNLPRIPRGASAEQMANIYNMAIEEVEYRINGYLQSNNVQEIGGWRVSQTELTSKDKDVGMSTADDGADPVRIFAGHPVKEVAPFRVSQAGKMHATGATIESSEGFPKIVMDPTGRLFAAYTSEDTYVGITPDYLGNGPGQIAVRGGVTEGGTYTTSGKYHLVAINGLKLESGEDIELDPGGSTGVIFSNWNRIFSSGAGQDLQVTLDTKAKSGVSTSGSGSHNHGIGEGVKLATTSDGSTISGYVTWFGVSNHTHSQN